MAPPDIEAAIGRALATGRASRGDDLRGFAIDLDYFLGQAGVDKPCIKKTGNPRCLLAATGRYRGTPSEIASSLARVWEASLRYPGPTMHAIDTGEDFVRLRFVTSTEDRMLVVTGEVSVRLVTE